MTTPNYWADRTYGDPPPTVPHDPRATRPEVALSKYLPGIKDLLQFLALVLIGAVMVHDRLNPPAPPADGHLEANAKAYLRIQPSSLREVAKGIRSGAIAKDKVGEAIRAAHTPAANDLQDSLAASASLPDALDRAATAMEGILKK